MPGRRRTSIATAVARADSSLGFACTRNLLYTIGAKGGVRCATMSRLPQESSLHTEAAGSASPDAFGPFRVLHQIGAGALGPVFRAYEPERDRLVAVKVFKLDVAPERVHQFVSELERLVAADLTHPALAAPLAAGVLEASAYLAQDDFVAE